MLRKLKPRAPGLLIALVVLAVAATSGSAVAGSLITSKQIKNGTIKFKDMNKGARAKLAGDTGPQGPQGAGDQGAPGPATGPAGGALSGSYPAPAARGRARPARRRSRRSCSGVSDGALRGEAHRAPMTGAPAITRDRRDATSSTCPA